MNYPQQSNGCYPVYTDYYTPVVPTSQKEVKEYHEKKELKSDINSIGLLMIISCAVFYIFSRLFAMVYLLFIGDYQFADNFDSVAENLLGGISNVLPIGLCGLFYIIIRKPKTSEVLVFEKVNNKKLLSVIAIGFSVCMLSNLMTSLYLGVTSSIGINLDLSYESAVSNSPVEILVYLVSVAVVPAFSEEILFRGAILSTLRKYGDGFAVMVSAFFFGLFHGNFVQFPFAMIVGMVIGWAVVYTNSLLPAILIHFCNNAFSVLSDVVYTNSESLNLSTNTLDIINSIIVIMIAAGAIVSAVCISQKDKNFLTLKKHEGTLKKNEIKKVLFTSPTVIVAFCLLMVETLFNHIPG